MLKINKNNYGRLAFARYSIIEGQRKMVVTNILLALVALSGFGNFGFLLID